MTKKLSEKEIESKAAEVWRQFCIRFGADANYPVPADRIALDLFDADVDWASLGDGVGDSTVLGKLRAPSFGKRAEILLNLDLINTLFEQSKSLFNTVVAHELGHLVFHVPSGNQLQLGLDLGVQSEFEVRYSQIEILMGNTIDHSDQWWREWQANTFARHLLIPSEHLSRIVGRSHHVTWPTIYKLSSDFCVTPSMMRVQLIKIGARVPGTADLKPTSNLKLRF